MEASEATEEVPTVHDPPPPVSAHLICSTKALLNDMVVQGGHSSHRIRYGKLAIVVHRYGGQP